MIFEDGSARRGKIVLAAFGVLLLSALVLFVFWVASRMIHPPLNSVIKHRV